MEKLTLNGTWQLQNAETHEIYSATVPGTQYHDLLLAGAIADPFEKINEKSTHWVGEKDWIYEREFDVSEKLLGQDMQELCFDMLDTICTVTLNGEEILHAENMHLAYRVDVKGKLKANGNTLVLYFSSPVKYVKEKNKTDKMPTNMNGVSGVPHIRKAQCHFGWDWGPIIPVVGAVKDVYLSFHQKAKIEYFDVTQKHEGGKVFVTAFAKTSGDAESVRYELRYPSGKIDQAVQKSNATCTFCVENPELWWTADISGKAEQPLYSVTAEPIAGDVATDYQIKKIGLRTLVLDRPQDEFGTNFRFILNGVPLFIKGSNWIPADSFPDRVTEDVYEYYIKTVRDSNQNMLRVWGGGYYESDAFYDRCDRYGILVWQDFTFACAPYPFYNEAFLANVKAEVTQNVLRLKHRASLALWCGNNEIEAMTAGWLLMKKLVDWTKKFFWEILPGWLAELDPDTSFVEGSPIGTGFLKDNGADAHGDTHMWQVWHGLKALTYYRTRTTRFCSEFGLESLPDIRTIRGFAEEKDFSLASDVFMAHQKCMSGNNKMLYYMSTRFRVPKKFEDVVYYTQIIQEECVRDATEHFRRNRGRCNGAIYWQLNDCWPVSSWSSIDYRGRYKVLQYKSKEFNAPVSLSVEEDKTSARVFLLNDKREAFDGEMQYRLMTFSGEEIVKGRVKAAAGGAESVRLMEIDIAKFSRKHHRQIVLEVSLFDREKNFVSKRNTLFSAEKNLKFENPQLEKAVIVENGVAQIKVTAKNFARYVRINSPYGYLPYSDNAFDIMPGETKIITVPLPEDVSEEEYLRTLTVSSVYDVAPKGSRLGDFLLRLKIHLIPINIANWIYYSLT